MAKNETQQAKQVVTVVVASNKGGVGKTTTSLQLGAGLSLAGGDIGAVVLIDGDAQGHLGEYLGLSRSGDFAAALLGEKAITECLVEVDGFDNMYLMRGSESTWELERTFVKGEGQKGFQPLAERLQQMIDMLPGIAEDGKTVVVIIDTAPSYSEIQTAALLVADYILCPLTPTIGGEMGMVSMREWVTELGHEDKGFGVLPQMYDMDNNVHKRTLRTIQNMIGQTNIYPAIPYSTELAEALDNGTTVWQSRRLKGTPVADQYTDVLSKLVDNLHLNNHKGKGKKK